MPFDVFAFGLFSVAAVENLSGHCGVVTVVGEVLCEGSVILIFGNLTEERRESVDAGGIRAKSEHE